jgi:hypothetical protein
VLVRERARRALYASAGKSQSERRKGETKKNTCKSSSNSRLPCRSGAAPLSVACQCSSSFLHVESAESWKHRQSTTRSQRPSIAYPAYRGGSVDSAAALPPLAYSPVLPLSLLAKIEPLFALISHPLSSREEDVETYESCCE